MFGWQSTSTSLHSHSVSPWGGHTQSCQSCMQVLQRLSEPEQDERSSGQRVLQVCPHRNSPQWRWRSTFGQLVWVPAGGSQWLKQGRLKRRHLQVSPLSEGRIQSSYSVHFCRRFIEQSLLPQDQRDLLGLPGAKAYTRQTSGDLQYITHNVMVSKGEVFLCAIRQVGAG